MTTQPTTTYKLIAVSDPAPEVKVVVDGQEIEHSGPGVVEIQVEGDLDLMIFKNGEPLEHADNQSPTRRRLK